MSTDSKSTRTVATIWLVTLATAYWLGTTRSDDAPVASEQEAGERTATTSNGLRLQGAGTSAKVDGSRPLSSATPGGLGGLGSRGPERILQLLSGAVGNDLRRGEFRDIAEQLSLEEVVGLIDQLATMDPGPAQRDAYDEVLARWAQLDAGAALDHASNISAPGLRREATINVLRHWAATNPAAALDFASNNPDSNLPAGSIAAVFRGIGNAADTSAALDFLATLDGSGNAKYADGAIRELFERNDSEVIEWTPIAPGGWAPRPLDPRAHRPVGAL